MLQDITHLVTNCHLQKIIYGKSP